MRLRLGDVTLGYDDRGSGDVLALLHPFLLDRRVWQDLAIDLARRHRVVTLDFRGLGESTGVGTIDDAADDLRALLDHLRIPRAVVGGLSMGGYVALAFARRHPGRLAGLLLADTRATADSDEGRELRNEAITQVVRDGVPGYAALQVPRLLAGDDRKVRALVTGLAGTQTAGGVAGALAALRDRPDATPGLSAIAVPTTVVVGADDVLTPPAEMRALAAAIPGAELVEIPRAGHLASLENPAAFLTAVEALLRRAPTA